MSSPVVPSALRECAARHAGLELLVLFGSHARGTAHPGSDWDLGYLSDGSLDVDQLLLELVRLLGTEWVDLVDLRRGNGLLRYRAARDGVAIFEKRPGLFDRFWREAVWFWLDAQPVIRAAHEDVLRGF